MSKLVVTRYQGRILTALVSDGRCRTLNLEPEEQQSLLGNIYIGKVKNVVKNINAAFIDLGGGQMGYYSLTENRDHLFADSRSLGAGTPRNESVRSISEVSGARAERAQAGLGDLPPLNGPVSGPGRPVRAGDEIIVQVARDAVKTKDPVLSCYLNFTGKYAVLTLGKTQIGFSAKIKDSAWKEEIRSYLQEFRNDRFGIIVRTNAEGIGCEALGGEIQALQKKMEELLEKSRSRTCFSLLNGSEPSYVLSLRDTYAGSLTSIVTDDAGCYEQMRRYLAENQAGDLDKLTFYEDKLLPLIKLYSLETAVEEAKAKRVWLKSGGYLVLEPTEALTVIDVNTGKYSGKKNASDTILKINLEAAEETARQLTLRNLSGIIIVDFIDMLSEEHKGLLLARLETELKKDPVKAVLVEMTKLGLVEITRKKVRRPFHEMLHDAQESGKRE